MENGEDRREQELAFARTLEKVRRRAVEKGGCIAEEEVEAEFGALSLSEEQLGMVLDYLRSRRIRVGGEAAEAETEIVEADGDGAAGTEPCGELPSGKHFSLYLKELEELEKVSGGEMEALTLSAMAGDTAAQRRLAELWLPEVPQIARLYEGQGVELEDLVGEGNLAVLGGVTMLGCLENASEARGMLGKMIMDAMEELISEGVQAEKTERKILDKVNRVADSARELAGELRRKVTVEELSRETEFTEEEIREAVRLSGGQIDEVDERQ